jgi:hypothetical protein
MLPAQAEPCRHILCRKRVSLSLGGSEGLLHRTPKILAQFQAFVRIAKQIFHRLRHNFLDQASQVIYCQVSYSSCHFVCLQSTFQFRSISGCLLAALLDQLSELRICAQSYLLASMPAKLAALLLISQA